MSVSTIMPSRFLLSIVVLMLISTGLVAQKNTSKNINSSDSFAGGTYDVRQISFIPWEKDSPTREYAQSPDDGKLLLTQDDETGNVIGATAFQVVGDKIIYINSSAGIVVVDMKSGKTVSKFSVYPFATNFVYENGKYYINTIEHSVDVYDESGKLNKSYPYERKYSGTVVRYNNSTYVVSPKEATDYQFDGYVSVEIERNNEKANRVIDGSIDRNGNIISTLVNDTYDYSTDPMNDSSSKYTFVITTPAGKKFTKDIFAKANFGYYDTYSLDGISMNRIFISKVEIVSEDPAVSKTTLQAYSFDPIKGIGNDVLSQVVIPFSSYPFLTFGASDLSVSSDGTVYQMLANEDGTFIFALREVKASQAHMDFPKILIAPNK